MSRPSSADRDEPSTADGDSSKPQDGVDRGADDGATTAEASTIAAVLAGDVDGFRALVSKYQDRVFTTLHRLVGDQHVAEELAQQSFVDAFAALASFDKRRSFVAWLLRITINNGKDWLKSHKRRERPVGKVANERGAFSGRLPNPERVAVSGEGLARLAAALAQLPAKLQEVVILKDVHELSYKEIREVLGLPITTLKMRVVRGRAALRKLLDINGGE